MTACSIPSLPPWPSFPEDEVIAATNVLQSGKVNYWTGQECRLFEKEYAAAVGAKYAIALMNGTVALEAALYALGIRPGDEVITTSRTFIASASAIVMCGATPVLADVDAESQNITAKTIAAVITPRTKAIIVVHLAGWPCEMQSIMTLAKEHGLFVIEDCAQAHGAAYQNHPVGSLGDVAAFSFCQDKIMTTGGEGGMVTTNSEIFWEKVWSYKDHGKSYQSVYHKKHPPGFRFVHESFGTNWRMTEVQGAIGRIQLKKLPEWRRLRERNATLFNVAFADLYALRLTLPPKHITHAYYKYYFFVRPDKLKPDWHRDRLMQAIHAAGVPCQSGICGEIYLEKAFIDAKLTPAKRFPVAKELGETSLMLMVHPTLSEEHIKVMANIVRSIVLQATR